MDQQTVDWTLDTGQVAAPQDTLSAREAADELGVHERTIRRAISRGDLLAAKEGGVYRIARDDLARYRTQSPASIPIAKQASRDSRLILSGGQSTASPGWVPQAVTPLIGREREVAAVLALLGQSDVRLVTLTGSGGVGKTRLAIEASKRAAPSFSDGAVFINLAAVTESEFVASDIAQALGIADTAAPPEERLEAVLATREMLLLLDNFEHVIEAAPLIPRLISACPRLTVLATSRVRLRLSNEVEFTVPPLVLPMESESVDQITEIASVRLFTERVRAVDPSFEVTDQNSANVVEICRRLEGLPLAIELAAPKLKVLPVATLAAKLEHQLPLLVGGSRDQPLRQQSMRQTIAWSHDLLKADEQRLLRWMSVFVDGCSWEAVEAIGACIGLDAADIVETVAALIDNALIRSAHSSDNLPRFQIPEPIRDFALEQLHASGEVRSAQEAHAQYFLGMIERGGPIFGPQHLARVQENDRESGNLHAALNWCIEHEQTELSLRLANAMGFAHWTARGRFRVQRIWMRRVLDMPSSGVEVLRADAWVRLGWAEMVLGNVQAALSAASRGLADARLSGNDSSVAWSLNVMGLLDSSERNYAAARDHLQEALIMARSASDQPLMALVHSSLGYSYLWSGAYEEARIQYEESISILLGVNDPWTLADAQLDLAFALRKLGRAQESAGFFREALWRELEFGDDYMLSGCMHDAAAAAGSFGRFEDAAMLLGAAAQMQERGGFPILETALEEHSSIVEAARNGLGDHAFAHAWSSGEALSLEDAVVIADRVTEEWGTSAALQRSESLNMYGLSRRELEVLRLLVTGRTNREIAETLFISIPTVKVHVGSIFNKLGLDSRTAAATFAIQHRLT